MPFYMALTARPGAYNSVIVRYSRISVQFNLFSMVKVPNASADILDKNRRNCHGRHP